MEVKDAIGAARKHLLEVFQDEGVVNLGLEEVAFDDIAGVWEVTFGFTRAWEMPQNNFQSPSRTYKVITINDDSGKIASIRPRTSPFE
jgi:hypothetical protein